MKITNVDSSISFTMTFSQDDASRLVEITRAIADVFERVDQRGVICEQLETAQEGLGLLYEMVESLEDLR
jgi:hypothetical protein